MERMVSLGGLAAFIALAVGAMGELLQSFGSRLTDVVDLANDAAGVVAFLAVFAYFDDDVRSSLQWPQRVALASLALGAAAATVVPFMWYAYVVQARAAAMPRLLSFESGWETVIYSGSGTDAPELISAPGNWPDSSNHVALLVLDHPRIPGLKVYDFYPDWTGYKNLVFMASAVGEKALEVSVRVHDKDHNWSSIDRFGRRILIEPEPKMYRISLDEIREAPHNRDMDLARIDAIIFYVQNPNGGERILIDDIRLE